MIELAIVGFGSGGSVGWLNDWTALGSKIKLEALSLYMDFPRTLNKSVLNAISNPTFCPFLKEASGLPVTYEELWAGLAQRRQRE